MKLALHLMAQYDGLAVIPVERVCADYFAPLTVPKFLEKTMNGEIAIPIVRMYGSQKAAKGVYVEDLAAYLSKRIEAARKEAEQMKAAG